MHPDLSRRLAEAQLQEALNREGLFCDSVQFEEFEYPLLYVRFTNRHSQERLLRFECTNYDFQPLAIEPVDPVTRGALSPEVWMLRNGESFPLHPMKDNRPFLCFNGSRDFYTFPGHLPTITGDRWEKWRTELKIVDVIAFLKERFVTGKWE